MYKGYFIDLDGTAHRGKEVIHEALEFVKQLQKRQIPYLFVTNNSTKTPEMFVEFLSEFGYPVSVEHIYTPALATAQFIADQKPNASVYAIGEIGLKTALEEKGLTLTENNPDYVVIGLDRQIDYHKLSVAALAIRQGAMFISTNGDIAIPTEKGLLPGNGALTAVLTTTTGVQPFFIGKPEAVIMQKALEYIGLPKEDVAMIGDNYFTDILAGISIGMPTIFVETGVSTKVEIQGYDSQPTHMFTSLSEFIFED